MKTIQRFAVIGNPIEHSLSPVIHDAFAQKLGIDLRYERILASVDEFSEMVGAFFSEQGVGLNVTLPFKEKAFLLVKHLTERSKNACAVNTIYLNKERHLCGDNTDGIGLRRDLEKNLKVELCGKKILLFGAGGAARGVVGELIHAKPFSLTVANRTFSRAEELIELLKQSADPCIQLTGGGLELGVCQDYDVVINASSRGFSNDEPIDFHVKSDGLVYDLSYGPHSKPFLNFGKRKCKRVTDGLGMLVEQAAEAFFCWHGIFPDTLSVITALRTGNN